MATKEQTRTAPVFRSGEYSITVRGHIPDNLREVLSRLHADAVRATLGGHIATLPQDTSMKATKQGSGSTPPS